MCAHMAGEIPCGYADGCLTREQTVLVAYHRGRMAPEHGVSGGLMAAVGLGAAAAEARLAKEGLTDVVVGCDNSAQNVTLAGAHFYISNFPARRHLQSSFCSHKPQ
jgi:fatty acid synthase